MRIVIKPMGLLVLLALVAGMFAAVLALPYRAARADRMRLDTTSASSVAAGARGAKPPPGMHNVDLCRPTGLLPAWSVQSQNGAAVALSATNGVLAIKILKSGSADYQLVLHQDGLNILDGELVTMTFQARSDRKQSAKVWAATDNGDEHTIDNWGDAFTVTPSWTNYTYSFNAQKAVPEHSRAPEFAFGLDSGTVYLRNVSVTVHR